MFMDKPGLPASNSIQLCQLKVQFACALLVGIVCCTGCARVFHKWEFPSSTVIGVSDNEFTRLLTGEMPKTSGIQHDSMADLYVRLSNKSVFGLKTLTSQEADRWNVKSQLNSDGIATYYIDNSNYYFRDGKLVGADLGRGVRVSRFKTTAYFEFPMDADDVVALLGEPTQKLTVRGLSKLR